MRTVLHVVELLVFLWFLIGIPIAIFNMITGGVRQRQTLRESRNILDRGPRQIVDTIPAPKQRVEKVRRLERWGRRGRGDR